MKLAGSIAALTHCSLPEAARQLDRLGVDYIHVDCNDDPRVFDDIGIIRANSRRPIDLHIVSPKPEDYFALVSRFNVEQVCFQYETAGRVPAVEPHMGARVGLALKPETDLGVFERDADRFQFLMLMATTPGQSGGAFDDSVYARVREARKRFPDKSLHVDGGVTAAVSEQLRECGVDCVVSGTFLTRAASLSHAILAIKNGTQAGFPVRNFMLARNALPTLAIGDLSLRNVLEAIDRSKMGLVMVVDDRDALQGMITDGDVRRGVLQSGGELALPDPRAILNTSPLTLSPEMTLGEALHAIEKVQRTIVFIPVVDADRRLVGGLGLRQVLEG